MKKIFISLLLVLGSIAVEAQELTWETDINKAIKVSNKTKKPMLLFFTGSDWCGWCIRLQKEVLKTPEFAKWAKENVVLVELDYPRRTAQSEALKAQNAGLQQAFGVQGFPTVWLATATQKDGKPSFTGIGNTGYVAGGPSAWLSVANDILKKK
jgi:thioredoxin-related protein